MFTGIITDIGEISRFSPTAQGQLHRLRIACRYDQSTIADGASIACNGVCLTVVGSGVADGQTWFDVDAAAETLRMTTAQHWTQGSRLNLERALKIGDELGGHIVAGHADGIATIVARDDLPDMARFELRAPRELARFIAPKGSITLDGVSLTVNTVADDQFSVLIIPHTLTVTTIGDWREGQEINIEVDLMARYAARLTEMRA
ncbi:riboflavin synthase [Bradyrhizobium sp. U87765 SZCCT0131]|uniref:riboflavin synthase n=1 Tax=unclassified Bradyrhizobium TaxID=2631580 RepID=UPI001BA93357|nr:MULTISPECIES: riboflavin synthase [unclassified Bradyrhizobium]MBR1219934.1 riboflavin synthase [Bradyrhizobium sp. U87765 SZCCT0131]MBR1263610.1 riboflavin synthase [Bradyrhizobium sp. U87765 SZCCT0134]MBR1309179.1 riboflavin synthase [Bradyrhizobium sp. U87765 SZCCT0110]MBR1323942.1 riboflavin synthase [Bradyrhizobium sp. U87765 SZCCT0109]MBR1349494.1 riboflavin synthase [Bradyrhizobium sp. U87765 SZCCT0048]